MFLQTGHGISSWSLLPSQTDLSSYSRTECTYDCAVTVTIIVPQVECNITMKGAHAGDCPACAPFVCHIHQHSFAYLLMFSFRMRNGLTYFNPQFKTTQELHYSQTSNLKFPSQWEYSGYEPPEGEQRITLLY